MFDLTDKVALVTGGSRGIGRAISEALASRGAHVVVNYVSNEGAAQATVDAIRAKGGKAELLRFDVAATAEAEKATAELGKRLGRLDILVSSAGISVDALMLRLKDEDLDRMFAINVKGALACAKGALKVMGKARAGRIVFLSSVVGESGNVGQTGYAATKAALLGAMKSLAREYAGRTITFNAIAPGYIDTDMTRSISEEARSAMVAGVPLGRPGTAAEVAAAAVYLASDEAGYVTGQVLRVNGGMYL